MLTTDPEKDFSRAIIIFAVLIAMSIIGFASVIVVRSESFDQACKTVQDNNTLFIRYLEETEDRALTRIGVEESEGKNPVSSRDEIKLSFQPFALELKSLKC